GLPAATLMAELRHGARALAVVEPSPSRLLDALATTLTRRDAFATATYFRIDPSSGRAVWASAGHLPALLVHADGSAALLSGQTGPPLGTPEASWDESAVVLQRGDALVLFTDGLVERRPAPIDDGLQRLRQCAEKYAGATVDTWRARYSSSSTPGGTTMSASSCSGWLRRQPRHRDDRRIERDRARRPEERRVPETEDAAVGGDQPVPLAVRGRSHPDHGPVEVHASHRAEELGIAEGEHAAVGRD